MASQLFDEVWQTETTDLCKIVSFTDTVNVLNPNMLDVRNYIHTIADDFNVSQNTVKFTSFQWIQDHSGNNHFDPTDDEVLAAKYYLMGLRLGPEKAKYKVAMICHLDTVPATAAPGWAPFDPYVERNLDYEVGTQSPQDFLVGRGCVDDKGPAVSALIVARALASKYDNTDTFDDVALEILFDGSEETDMATPNYLEDPNARTPDFGIVFDAFWCTRAEKGGDRPHFEVPYVPPPDSGLYVSSVISNPGNSANTIADWAEAEIRGDDASLQAFASVAKSSYERYIFDDPDYRRAKMEDPAPPVDGVLTLRTVVEGAQHGSSPDENRASGANPLVSLANFVGGLTTDGTFGTSTASTMCKFVEWMWGTTVFGENHRKELYGFDDIFLEGNGTTYALSKMTAEDTGVTWLEIDIRYALAHHVEPWDGVTEGFVDGDHSVLAERFTNLIGQFNMMHPKMPDVVLTNPAEQTLFVPDIRVPDTNESFQKVEQAFKDVRGHLPPRLAIGGGTDAKGVLNLLAVGPLFSTMMGPPVNYHGISEAAPIVDMKESTKILERTMELEVLNPPSESSRRKRAQVVRKGMRRLKEMQAKGFRHQCNC